MARLTPASWSFWAMAQAMLRLLARPKTTAVRPSRLSISYSLKLSLRVLVSVPVMLAAGAHLVSGETQVSYANLGYPKLLYSPPSIERTNEQHISLRGLRVRLRQSAGRENVSRVAETW